MSAAVRFDGLQGQGKETAARATLRYEFIWLLHGAKQRNVPEVKH